MLARRYLNPRRAVLSSFTLISLVGVLLGVLVLVVVMAVFAGLERDVKGRLLGFTPHILVKTTTPALPEEIEDAPPWQDLAKETKKLPGVAAATAYVADNVILDVGTWQRPVSFRGIDTTDAAQVKGVADMLDRKNFPDSSADLGLDDDLGEVDRVLRDLREARAHLPLELAVQRLDERREVGDRAEAILRGVDALGAGDALLIAGKGHESGQTIGSTIYPFDDLEQASLAITALDGVI
jgi:hypothetical protein